MEIHEGKQLKQFVKNGEIDVKALADKLGVDRGTIYYNYKKEDLGKDFKREVAKVYGVDVAVIWPGVENISNRITGDELRAQKAYGDNEDEGLIYVPVAAQAGYAKHFTEPQFLFQCKRWVIPDFPYKGDKYRIFEVEGDSMQYSDNEGKIRGLLSGYQVIGERVDPENWKYSTQWYVHILVFEDMLTIKRIYRDDKTQSFVLICDNPDYPQKRVAMESVKELWVMKRYMGWDMSPPVKYDITV